MCIRDRCRGLCNYWWDTGQRSIAGLAALHFVTYFEHTQNRTWLRRVGYPFLQQVAEFYRTWLWWDPRCDCYRIINSSGGERDTPTSNNTQTDASYCRVVLGAAVRYAEQLQLDSGLQRQWMHLLENLEPFAESQDPITGETVYVFADQAERHKFEPALSLAFPSGVVGLDSPNRSLDTARRTARSILGDRPTSLPGRACFGWAAFTRLLHAQEAPWLLSTMSASLNVSRVFIPPTPGGGIEQAGIAEAINSMLIQSHQGVLHVFPVWAPEAGAARFAGLSAAGGFQVSARFHAGVVAPFEVKSIAGRRCIVHSPWARQGVRVTDMLANRSVHVNQSAGGTRFGFDTCQGHSYLLSPTPLSGI
eukprot:TRINITY_DN49141_c0_g1_i2.p1 TRINITY_DN49141_c0_g1~~TRINITY_DN49141_c0_g1_i2.p1  ORF type:complete len:363 (+),score=71.17 TRINITY_DN49141_c0_g1_i2:165-1253(+)